MHGKWYIKNTVSVRDIFAGNSQVHDYFFLNFEFLRTKRLAFTKVWVGFTFLQKKNFTMHYNRKIMLLME